MSSSNTGGFLCNPFMPTGMLIGMDFTSNNNPRLLDAFINTWLSQLKTEPVEEGKSMLPSPVRALMRHLSSSLISSAASPGLAEPLAAASSTGSAGLLAVSVALAEDGAEEDAEGVGSEPSFTPSPEAASCSAENPVMGPEAEKTFQGISEDMFAKGVPSLLLPAGLSRLFSFH